MRSIYVGLACIFLMMTCMLVRPVLNACGYLDFAPVYKYQTNEQWLLDHFIKDFLERYQNRTKKLPTEKEASYWIASQGKGNAFLNYKFEYLLSGFPENFEKRFGPRPPNGYVIRFNTGIKVFYYVSWSKHINHLSEFSEHQSKFQLVIAIVSFLSVAISFLGMVNKAMHFK